MLLSRCQNYESSSVFWLLQRRTEGSLFRVRRIVPRSTDRFAFGGSRRRWRAAVRAASRSGTLKIETQTLCRRVRRVVLAALAPTTQEVRELYCSADDVRGIGLQILFFSRSPPPPTYRRPVRHTQIEIMPTRSDRQYYYYYYFNTHAVRYVYIYIILFLLKIKTGPRMRVPLGS